MLKLLKLPKEELNAVLINTAAKKGIDVAIVEKDLWVCVTLYYLFSISKWKDKLAFKGGTCLSKAYHLIERFSEDIDLIIDWRVLGYSLKEPLQERSKSQQQVFNDDSKERLFDFLQNEFLFEFKTGMSELLGIDCNIYIDKDDLGTIVFAYPHSFVNKSILSTIRLEIGALSSWYPLNKTRIKSFIAEEYPNVISNSIIELLVTTPERAFWEKVTILHQESFRPNNLNMPMRYSRHYYDVYCMCRNGIKKSALKDRKLLKDVAVFKNKFYPRKWARYDLAETGKVSLMPATHSVDLLKKDYSDMKSMIYGYYPSLEEILKVIAELEKEINESN